MAISKAQMSMLQRRRTTDIDRLAQQYKSSVESLTGDYQKSFGEYQARTAEQMKPFEEQMAKYKTDLYPAYEKQVETYRSKLSAYQKAIEDFPTSAGVKVNAPAWSNRGGSGFIIDGVQYRKDDLPANYFMQDIMGEVPETVLQGQGRGARRVQTGKMVKQVVGQELRKRTPPEAFTEKPPEAPKAPDAPPQVAEFDASQFDQRRGQLETEFKREVGERKSARLSAVSRRSSRPMLQGS